MDLIVLVTTRDKLEAKKIGRTLIEEKLVGCINCFDGVDSIYWWKDKIEEAQEAILLVKTERMSVSKVIQRIKQMHSYESPSIITLPASESCRIHL